MWVLYWWVISIFNGLSRPLYHLHLWRKFHCIWDLKWFPVNALMIFHCLLASTVAFQKIALSPNVFLWKDMSIPWLFLKFLFFIMGFYNSSLFHWVMSFLFFILWVHCCLAIDNLMHWKNIILVLALFSRSSNYIYKTFYSLTFSTIISVFLNYFSQRKYQFKNSNYLIICFYFVFYLHSNFLPGIIQLPEVTPGLFCCLLFMLIFVHLLLSPRLGYLWFYSEHYIWKIHPVHWQ